MPKVALFAAWRSVRTLRGNATGQTSWQELVLFSSQTRLAEEELAQASCLLVMNLVLNVSDGELSQLTAWVTAILILFPTKMPEVQLLFHV